MPSLNNRIPLLTTFLAGVVAVIISWFAVGSHGPGSAGLGAILVLAFFSASDLPFIVAGDTKDGRGAMAFVILGMTFVLRLMLGFVAYQVASRSDAINSTATGLTIIGCALVWTNTRLAIGLQKRHQPMLDMPAYVPPGSEAESSDERHVPGSRR